MKPARHWDSSRPTQSSRMKLRFSTPATHVVNINHEICSELSSHTSIDGIPVSSRTNSFSETKSGCVTTVKIICWARAFSKKRPTMSAVIPEYHVSMRALTKMLTSSREASPDSLGTTFVADYVLHKLSQHGGNVSRIVRQIKKNSIYLPMVPLDVHLCFRFYYCCCAVFLAV